MAWHDIIKQGRQTWICLVVASEEVRSALLARLGCLGALRFGCVALPLCFALLCLAGGVVVGGGYWGKGAPRMGEALTHTPPRHSAVLRRLFLFLAVSFFSRFVVHHYGLRLNLSGYVRGAVSSVHLLGTFRPGQEDVVGLTHSMGRGTEVLMIGGKEKGEGLSLDGMDRKTKQSAEPPKRKSESVSSYYTARFWIGLVQATARYQMDGI
ncbi:hypothetical protein F5144DRAFT_577774 [Chaetomium tenue]|uniref:Uncharacterized protein n=1 Tax=Chaetomium tenue TaxID=1854479 RepID=A0ACB7P4D0_9PEZI|nr:hypothetical protein F5144DRAFT_577774 [Chaetomium globosum]